MKIAMKIGLGVAVAAAIGVALFAVEEMNLIPKSSHIVRGLSPSRLWAAGNFLCADASGAIRCVSLGSGQNPVDNAVEVPFLKNPDALVSRTHTCALEDGEIRCWDMRSLFFSGVGLVYSPAQQQAGTLQHGAVRANAALKLALTGRAKRLIDFYPLFCVLDDEGARCFRDEDESRVMPMEVFHQTARSIFSANHVLCAGDPEALHCFEHSDPTLHSPQPPLIERYVVVGTGEIVSIAAGYGSVCALTATGVACAHTPTGHASPPPELHLEPVAGLNRPTQLWNHFPSYFALDGTRIMTWDESGKPAPVVWSMLKGDDRAFVDPDGSWFLFRSGTVVKNPNEYYPKRFSVPGPPSQVVRVGFFNACALSDGQVACFDN